MKKLLVISGKGGTGKTTVAASLIHLFQAKAFADCDVDAPNLHLIGNFENEKPTLKKNFFGGKKAEIIEHLCDSCKKCKEYCRFDAIHEVDGKMQISPYFCEGCCVCSFVCDKNAISFYEDLSGEISLYQTDSAFASAELKMGRGNSGKLVTEVKNTLFSEKIVGDVAILDGAPGVGCPVMASLADVDLALLVTEPTVSGESDLRRIAKTVKMCFVPMAVLINRYDVNREKSLEIENWCKEEQIPFVGTLPYDKAAFRAVNAGKCAAEVESSLKDALEQAFEKVQTLLHEEKKQEEFFL